MSGIPWDGSWEARNWDGCGRGRGGGMGCLDDGGRLGIESVRAAERWVACSLHRRRSEQSELEPTRRRKKKGLKQLMGDTSDMTRFLIQGFSL